jgi:hypothetical protein
MVVMKGIDFGTISVTLNILTMLLIFAYLYDRKIGNLGARGEGWAWLQVVVGVSVTLIGIGLLDLVLPCWNAGLIGLLAFAVSGAPMCYGAYLRHREAEERAHKAMQE